MKRVLLIGEAPPHGRPDWKSRHAPLAPLPANSAGGRLARLLELSERQYLRRFPHRLNVCPAGPFHLPTARANAVGLARGGVLNAFDDVVLVGRNVAEAFDWREPYFEWRDLGAAIGVLVPHPSGRNRMYNDGANVLKLRETLLRD